jgi:tRNA nucleotidyltransferase (CCA-adding enzyme)
LAVNGRDLIDGGLAEGIQIGVVLNRLLDMVIDEDVENERDVLMGAARELG